MSLELGCTERILAVYSLSHSAAAVDFSCCGLGGLPESGHIKPGVARNATSRGTTGRYRHIAMLLKPLSSLEISCLLPGESSTQHMCLCMRSFSSDREQNDCGAAPWRDREDDPIRFPPRYKCLPRVASDWCGSLTWRSLSGLPSTFPIIPGTINCRRSSPSLLP